MNPEMHEYGFRAAVNITPGVDWLWGPWVEPEHLRCYIPSREVFVKVIGSEVVVTGLGRRVCLTLECPSGRTYTRTMAAHRHQSVFYPKH